VSVPPPGWVERPLVAVAARAAQLDAFAERTGLPVSTAALAALFTVGGLVILQLWAVKVAYPLRVTSDVPTYLALIRSMISNPIGAQSPFLVTGGVASPHATPYIFMLAKLWAAIAPPGHLNDPLAIGRFLGLFGIPVAIATLGMIWWYAASVTTGRKGLLAVAVVLVMFGPANVIWANDLTFHAFLYAGFYPQNVAIATALGALVALRKTGRISLAIAAVLTGATMIVHPLTGEILCGLAAGDGCLRALRGEKGVYRCSAALALGFLAGTAWPDYKLNEAMGEANVPGAVIVAACAMAPRIAAIAMTIARVVRKRRPHLATRAAVVIERRAARIRSAEQALTSRKAILIAAIAGAAIVAIFAIWEVALILTPPSDPLIHSNRLATYWGEDRWRWFLMMLGGGAAGVPGLVRLARTRTLLPLLWFAGAYGLALLGQLGLPIPVWWRFLLYGQVPLAIGVAVVLAEASEKRVRRLIGGTLGFALAFKLVTLLALPTTITYFGAPLQPDYSLASIIPSQPSGLVASDPFTSYYIPAATGRHVLTTTKAHAESQSELDASSNGYDLLHAFYVAPDDNWWGTAINLWNAGVRYVLLEKRTSLAPPNLTVFSTGPTPLVRTKADSAMLGRVFWRLGRVGTVVHSDREFVVYELDATKLEAGNSGSGGS
jgi:hypothetical protein